MRIRSSAVSAAIFLSIAGTSPLSAQIATGDPANGVRLNAIEEQLRQLTGEVDRLSRRVQQLEAAAGMAASGNAAAQGARTAAPAPQGNAGQPARGAPPSDLGQLRLDQNGQPLDITGLSQALSESAQGGNLSAPDTGTPSAVATATGADSPRDAYDAAYGYVLRGDYDAAEQAFGAFIDRYPDDELVPNAKFWIGESYFQRGDYHNAARAFLDNSQSHPEAAKAPESMLKLGLSLAALQQKDAACSSLNELMRRYPRSEASVRDQAQSEIRALGC